MDQDFHAQLKRLEDHYLPLLRPDASGNVDKATKTTFLRELLTYLRDICMNGNENKEVTHKAFNYIIDIVTSDTIKDLPIDLAIINHIALDVEHRVKMYNDWDAVHLFYVIVDKYPEIVANAPNLINTVTEVLKIRNIDGVDALSAEYYVKILDFYSSFCLETRDKKAVFRQNVNILFPELIIRLMKSKGLGLAKKALTSIIVKPFAKDMCQAVYPMLHVKTGLTSGLV